MKIRIGTRGSQLALAQSTMVAGHIAAAAPGIETEVVIVQTRGDRVLDAPLSQIGGKGVFTKEIENALLDRRIDLAVHSLKDLPTQNPPGLIVGAIPPRESPRDVLVTPRPRALDTFTAHDVIGTSSLRRAAQLRSCFPQVAVRELRGNVPTRLRRLMEDSYSAIVLAEAGIRRLGLTPPAMQVLDDEVMIPAPGQGALGLQIRDDDREIAQLLQTLNDVNTAACCLAERTLLDKLGGGCQVPLGAHATVLPDDHLRLRGRVISLDGRTVINCEVVGSLSNPAALGMEAAEVLRSNGALRVIEDARNTTISVPEIEPALGEEHTHRRVIVTRDEDADGPLSRELRALGIDPVCIPLIRTRILQQNNELEAACAAGLDWLVLGSAVAVQALAASSDAVHAAIRRARVACVGSATANALKRELDMTAEVVGDNGRDELLTLLKPMLNAAANRVLVAKGNLAPLTIEETLRAAGCSVNAIVVYETTTRDDRAALLRQLLADGECHAISFCSTSAVDAFINLIPDGAALLANSTVHVASIGDSTSAAARSHGLRVDVQPATPTFPEFAQALARALDAKSPT